MLIDRLSPLILGAEPQTRLRLQRMLIAAAVFTFCLVAQWYSLYIGMGDRPLAAGLTVFIIVGECAVFTAIRSGASRRFSDAALTMPQMVMAILSLALAYIINPQGRGMLLMVVALVLVFGAFTLSPRRCRGLGAFAVLVFAITMGFGAWHDPLQFPPRIEGFHFAFAAAVLPTLAHLAGQLSQLRLDQRRQRRELREAMDRLQHLATCDELTGLPNRRHVQEWLAAESSRMRRTGAPMCVALIDLDHFKRVNDGLGHSIGDQVLQLFAREARSRLREGDLLARWGGEEFLLLMPETAPADAAYALERLRSHMAQDATWASCPQGRVSFSAGLAVRQQRMSLEHAVQRADAALYDAKRLGRDRVCIAPPGDAVLLRIA
jgi:diguanylate cyclase